MSARRFSVRFHFTRPFPTPQIIPPRFQLFYLNFFMIDSPIVFFSILHLATICFYIIIITHNSNQNKKNRTLQQTRCHNGDCILASQRCDRISQCEDLSDEIHCGKSSIDPNFKWCRTFFLMVACKSTLLIRFCLEIMKKKTTTFGDFFLKWKI